MNELYEKGRRDELYNFFCYQYVNIKKEIPEVLQHIVYQRYFPERLVVEMCVDLMRGVVYEFQ